VISHACISAEGQHQPWLQPERSVRVVHFRECAQGQRCGARAPHVARQPQVHSIRQDHQHVTPLSANKITTTFSPLKMGAIYAFPPDVPPFNSQIRRSPSLRMADLTGRRVSITSSNPLDSDRPKRKARISRSVRPPGEGFGDDTNHPRQDLAAIRRIAQRPRFRCQSLEAAVALRLDTYRLSCLA
jgi:hypothetical protein